MSACSESQSTILPLPSSPHWAPTTTTFAMRAFRPVARSRVPGDAPRERKTRCRAGVSAIPSGKSSKPPRATGSDGGRRCCGLRPGAGAYLAFPSGLITGIEPGFGSGGVTTMPGAVLLGGLMTPSLFAACRSGWRRPAAHRRSGGRGPAASGSGAAAPDRCRGPSAAHRDFGRTRTVAIRAKDAAASPVRTLDNENPPSRLRSGEQHGDGETVPDASRTAGPFAAQARSA